MKKTDWYPGYVKPKRIGIYERNDEGTSMYDGGPNFSYWDGKMWRNSGDSVERADLHSGYGDSSEQNLPWRGLSEPAK
jgi:hypothetical protein